jgi:hypothetical protein
MNKLMTAAVIAGGLMLVNSPEAAAHKEVRNVYQPPAHYHTHIDMRRSNHMPRWLKRNKSFRHWYRHTPLKRDRRLAWHQLFDIYRFERRFGRNYYRSANYWNDYYALRYGERHFDRDRRDERRHRKHRH